MMPKVVNLNDLVVDMEKMLHRLIGEDVQLITGGGAGLGVVKADPGQIEQVLLNLVVNARDAMPKGGSISIRTANATLDPAQASAAPGAAPRAAFEYIQKPFLPVDLARKVREVLDKCAPAGAGPVPQG